MPKNGQMAKPIYFWQTVSKRPNGNPDSDVNNSSNNNNSNQQTTGKSQRTFMFVGVLKQQQ
jgi:hypothetical protein